MTLDGGWWICEEWWKLKEWGDRRSLDGGEGLRKGHFGARDEKRVG